MGQDAFETVPAAYLAEENSRVVLKHAGWLLAGLEAIFDYLGDWLYAISRKG